MTKYTKENLGFKPVADVSGELAYYKAFIAWANTEFDFVPDYDDEDYPRHLVDNPLIVFPEPDEDIYADFVATWDYVNANHTADEVVFAFNDDGELELSVSTWEG